MSILQNKIKTILNNKGFNQSQLSKFIDITDATLSQMVNGKAKFSENIINKLLPILEVSREEFESWIVADKYSKEILELAIQVKKAFPYKKKSVLTAKIDEILIQKEMSRTNLSKQINYSQSPFNAIITNKRPMSKPVLEKISQALEISQTQVLSWIIADKYSLQVLEQAWACL